MFLTQVDNITEAAASLRDKWMRAGDHQQGVIFGAVMQQIDERLTELRVDVNLLMSIISEADQPRCEAKVAEPEAETEETEEVNEDSGEDSKESNETEE